jgi:hypothetical protein
MQEGAHMTEKQMPGSDVPPEEQTKDSEILGEIQSLGQQLATAIKSMWESEESRKLRQEIGEGFVELGHQLDAAVKSAQESEAAKQFSEQVRDVVDKARKSDVTAKVEEGLVAGLRELNEQLSKVIDTIESDEPQEEPKTDPEA